MRLKFAALLAVLLAGLLPAEALAQSSITIDSVITTPGTKPLTRRITVKGRIFIDPTEKYNNYTPMFVDPKNNPVGVDIKGVLPPKTDPPTGHIAQSVDVTISGTYTVSVTLTYLDKGGNPQQDKKSATIPVTIP